MRISAIANFLAGSLLTATVFAGPAAAQSNPSADQIISALKPSGDLSETTRGIKPLPPGPGGDSGMLMAPPAMPAAMSMTQPAVPPPEASTGAPSTNLSINFQPGSATLTPQATAALDQLGKALTSPQLAAYNFKIAGHTDTVGDPATNQTLSEQRAAAVKSYLMTKFGVADTRLQAVGLGETDLLVPTPPQTPSQLNRRVQIINLGQ
jgi:outer membrane protein OmpA-like peptidoglycan-associated protein